MGTVEPSGRVIAVGAAVRSTSVPASVSVRVIGEPITGTVIDPYVAVTTRFPVSTAVSGTVRVNTTLTVQEVVAVAKGNKNVAVVGQVPAPVPVTTEYADVRLRLKVKGVSDVLVRVTVCGALLVPTGGSAKTNGVAGAVNIGSYPVPVRASGEPLTVTGEPLLEAVTLNVWLRRVPTAVGLKTTLIVQLVFASRDAPQVPSVAPCENTDDEKAKLRLSRLVLPGLLRVTTWNGLVRFTGTVPKFNGVAVAVNVGS
jgi:hypothetical protein